MKRAVWFKNKKGAALIFAIMVLLLLTTVVVAVTALASSSYSDAVLSFSDDQSYYYAKSVGLSVKEQFKDGYNINKIITQLNTLETQHESDDSIDPKISGTFNIADGEGEIASGTVQIRYAENADGTKNDKVIEVRTACVVNNSLAIVTSIFSCEDDSEEEVEHVASAMNDYDVILTNTEDLSLDFAQAGEVAGSTLRVYVYGGESNAHDNGVFKMTMNMRAMLTTTGKTTISSVDSNGNVRRFGSITGKLVSYGDLTLQNVCVVQDGITGNYYDVHVDGNTTLKGLSLLSGSIYSRGDVTINDPGEYIHCFGITASPTSSGYLPYVCGNNTYQSVASIYAQGNVKIYQRALVAGSIYSHGDVTVTGMMSNPYCGDACVFGDIYADGDVVIEKGAMVMGSVYAKGSVTVKNGAFVRCNVQSVNGDVSVLGAAVGVQVNCPNGELTLGNKNYANGSSYLIGMGQYDPYGLEYFANAVVNGGIGLLVAGNHTCRTLVTHDYEHMSKVGGNLFVETHRSSSNLYTDLYSIWIVGNLYLNDSIARFTNGSRTYKGLNDPGNAYTWITGTLHQRLDMYASNSSDVNKRYVDMAGAHLNGIIIGQDNNSMRDLYLKNGWISGSLFGRCVYLQDMLIDNAAINIYAQQYAEISGTATLNNGGKKTAFKNYSDYFDNPSLTAIRPLVTVNVECKTPGYSGVFTSENKVGFKLGKNAWIQNGTTVNVGSDVGVSSSYVILGDESAANTTFFWGTMNAYVASFKVSNSLNMTYSTIKAEIIENGGTNPNYDSTSIRPEAARNSFYVAPPGGNTQYRDLSTVEVKGNAYIAGKLNDFTHFNYDNGHVATFTNTDDARINGTFVSTGKELNLRGSGCFNKVHALNNEAVVKLDSDLNVGELLVNGTLNDNNRTLVVAGDLYANVIYNGTMYNFAVFGNMTVGSYAAGTALTSSNVFHVAGDLCLNKGDVLLTTANHNVQHVLETKNGSVSISGGASAYQIKTSKNLTVGTNGKVTGAIDVGVNFTLAGGDIRPASRVTSRVGGTYTHTSGYIRYMAMNVNGTGTAVNISGTASADGMYFNVPNGSASVTGGANVNYKSGNLIVKNSSTIAGGFISGITVTNGNLTIGTDNHSGNAYQVGESFQSLEYEPTDYEHVIMYASGNVVWKKGAKSYDSVRGFYPAITAGGDITMGSSDYYVLGGFSKLVAGGKITAYVEKVDGIYAKKTSYVYLKTKGYLGATIDDNHIDGAKIENGGDLHIYAQTSSDADLPYLRGENNISGTLYLHSKINVEARVQCKKVVSDGHADNDLYFFTTKSGDYANGLRLSLYLTDPGVTTYTLKKSLLKPSSSSHTGDFTVNANLTYNSPVKVEGELRVNGILTYNGSTEDVQSLGGLYCLNTKINITAAYGGNIHLPNVTEITLNAKIGGLNAPNVTKFTMNYDVEGSLTLDKCDSLTVGSGKTIGGSLKIKSSGKVTNNGTINNDVSCGEYTGSGTVGGNLVVQSSGKTSTVNGKVSGSVWSNGSLNIKTTASPFGKKDSFIFAKGDITIENVKFDSSMDYILTTGGNIKLINCTQIPKVWNMSGYISVSNDSSHATTIASILSYGTYIELGTKDDDLDNRITVNGNLEWNGKGDKTQYGYGVEFWGSKTTIKGNAVFLGEGDVHLASATYEKDVKAHNKGELKSSRYGGKIKGNLYINKSDDIRVTAATIKTPVGGNIVFYGTKGTTDLTFSSELDSNTNSNVISGTVDIIGADYVAFDGGVFSSNVYIKDATTVAVNKALSKQLTYRNGDKLTVKYIKDVNTIGEKLRLYNVKESNVFGNIGGMFYHTASTPSSASDMNVIRLGTEKQQIKVGGNIVARGRLVDNAKQTKADSIRAIQGAYYVDVEMSDDNCKMIGFKSEQGGNATVISGIGDDWNVDCELNIQGRLIVLTFWDEANNKWRKINFNKKVVANALIVNTELTSGNMSGSPSSLVLTYGKSENSAVSQGSGVSVNKRVYMEDLSSYSLNGNIWRVKKTSSESKELVVFKKNVYLAAGNGYNGTCHAVNTKFGGALYTEGQVSLNYCCLFSEGYSDDTNHCNYSSNSNGIKVADDGAFLHTSSAPGGDNYFNHVSTFSNVAVYYGVSHIYGGSVFKGCVYSGSGQSDMYKGHRSTKLFYFGESVELYGNSAITSNAQADVNLPSGRTIIWVNKGALVVRDSSYIGVGKDGKGVTSGESGAVNTNRHSQHPGVFVSHSSGSVKMSDGVTYEFGSAYIKGSKSSVTLDICAYRKILISDSAVVMGKDTKNSTHKYMAGLFVSRYGIEESSSGFFGFYHINSDVKGKSGVDKRKYYTGISDDSAYIPNGSKYRELFNKRSYSYSYDNWIQGDDIKDLTYTQTVDQLTQCYTPKSTAPSVTAPKALNHKDVSGGYQSGYTNDMSMGGANCSDWSIDDKKSDTAKPAHAVVGTNTSELTVDDASVNEAVAINNLTADKPSKAAWGNAPGIVASVVGEADDSGVYSGQRAWQLGWWGTVSFQGDPTLTTPLHPSIKWTSAITSHFDKTNTTYWSTRFIPYNWELPYVDKDGKDTPARRVLKGATADRNGTYVLKCDSSSENLYYVNQDNYSGSNLAGIASSILGWRKYGTDQLYDYLAFNGYDKHDGEFWVTEHDERRRSKLLVFESGELPYEAFYMLDDDDLTGWSKGNKDIPYTGINKAGKKRVGTGKQIGWYMGSDEVDYYDVNWVFYACTDPANPYGSAAKDLHVVLPQGIGVQFYRERDQDPCVTVVGKGRVFLYLTSGDTVYFAADATKNTSWYEFWRDSHPVATRPVGGLKKNGSYYEPQLYIIGAGTNIDLIIQDMPIAAVIYMPFGNKSKLYGGSGSYSNYNKFYKLAKGSGSTYSSLFSAGNSTTDVKRNATTLVWSDIPSDLGNPRVISGMFVTDNLYYSGGGNNLYFVNDLFRVNLSETKIYEKSTYSGSTTKPGSYKTYSLAQFLSIDPDSANYLLNWEYKGIKVAA